MLPPHFSEHRCPEKFVLSRLALKLMGSASSHLEPNIVHNWFLQSNSTFFITIFPHELLYGERLMSWSVVMMEEPVIEVSGLNRI
jgi:hypothetical protein